MWWVFSRSFGVSKYVTKMMKIKSIMALDHLSDNKEHTTINQKNAGQTEKGRGRMSNINGDAWGESK